MVLPDLLDRPALPADHRIAYGDDPSQFGDLWLPTLAAGHRAPVVVFFHGGWWKSTYDLGYAGYLCRGLRDAGIAVWSVEYRRVGRTGGGWPRTFQDAARGFDFVSTLSLRFPLDLTRVVVSGHSAGGHLAFWIAGRQHIQKESEIYLPRPQLVIRSTVSLAGAVDLRIPLELAEGYMFTHDHDEVISLMGGAPGQVPERYRDGNPGDLLPLACPQFLLQGTADSQVPPQLAGRWGALAHSRGSEAVVRLFPGAGHFDLVDPQKAVWPEVLSAFRTALK